MATSKLQQALNRANGRRRVRLLDLDDIVRAASQLQPGQHVFLHGGHVARAYGYPSRATGAVVWIPAGKRAAFATVAVVNAQRGCTGFGRESNWNPTRDAADAIRITPDDIRNHNHVSRRETA